jgi:transposase-like protein
LTRKKIKIHHTIYNKIWSSRASLRKMSPKKLSEADKQEILALYRESEETTSTLAERYEVSSSTISRFLKTNLSLEDYEELIQKKRLARTPYRRQSSVEKNTFDVKSEVESSETNSSVVMEREIIDSPATESRKMIKNQVQIPSLSGYPIQQLDLFPLNRDGKGDDEEDDEDDQVIEESVFALQQLLGEEIGEIEDYEDEDDEDDDYEDDEDILDTVTTSSASCNVSLEILPLTQAELPKVCYLVIDKRSELITRPLKDFRDLGKIPLTEIQEQTLPVFDNHRIARRFSNRRERVIKVPDSQIFLKTSPYLQAKGITRILLDGQVYSLDSD